MEQIKQWVKDFLARRAAHRLARTKAELKRRSLDELQVMEYNGTLYLSHCGVPLVSAELLQKTLPATLDDVRQLWLDYKLNNIERQQA